MHPRNKKAPRGFQPRRQIPQYERKRRAASVPGIKLNVYATPLWRLWYRAGRSPLRKPRLYRTVALACLCSRLVQKPCVESTYVSRYRQTGSWRPTHVQLASAVRPQLGQNLWAWPDLPHLKLSFNRRIVWRWLVEVEPARVHFRQTAGPRSLLPPRPLRPPRPSPPRWNRPFMGP